MSDYTVKSLAGKLILAATILASGMAFLDGTVVNIAIPVMQEALQTNIEGMQWVINSYALLLAALILISGSLGDRFGRKKIFLYGIGIFVVSSFLCSIAHSIGQLIMFRSLQGLGAAMMIPGSLSIINTSFAEREHGKAIGLWSGFAGGVAAIGPFIGGWLVQTFGWPSIFLINIPLGLIALYLTVRYVPETRNDEATSLDITGTILLFLGLLGLSYGLIEAPGLGLADSRVVAGFIVGIASLIAFIFTEKKVKMPLVPLHIFNSPLVIGANLVTLFLYFALNGIIFFLILNLQQLQHYSPLAAGLGMLPSILIITFLSGPAGSLSDKIGPRIPMIIGPMIVGIGMLLLTLPGSHAVYYRDFLPGLILFGIGMSLVIAPLTKSALTVNPKYSGAASGVNNAVSRIAALLAIALLGAIMATTFSAHLIKGIAASHLTPSEQQQIVQQRDRLGGIAVPKSFNYAARDAATKVIEKSFIESFRMVMGIGAFLAFISALISFLLIHPSKKK